MDETSAGGLLSGRSGFVTGAARGVGRGIAVERARQGAAVVVSDLPASRTEGLETVEEIRRTGGRAVFVAADVSSSDDVSRLVAETGTELGGLDFAVNNAGISPFGPLAEFADQAADAVIDVNLKGVFYGIKHAIRSFAERGVAGSIVNIASVAGISPVPQLGMYGATKHAILGLTKSAALEYGSIGVRVNAVLPNAIRTPAMEAAPAEFTEVLLGPQAIKRFGEAAEVGTAAAFLLSDQASFITGAALPVDGGYLLGT